MKSHVFVRKKKVGGLGDFQSQLNESALSMRVLSRVWSIILACVSSRPV